MMSKKEFEEKEATDGLMVRMKNLVWGTEKVVIMESELFLMEVFISMVEKGVLGVVGN